MSYLLILYQLVVCMETVQIRAETIIGSKSRISTEKNRQIVARSLNNPEEIVK